MDNKNFKIFFLFFSTCGFLFSGYMSGVKFFSEVCAFGETCPLFLGRPACYFGFAMFSLLFIFSLLLFFNKWKIKNLSKSLLVVSLAGVVFAGYFSAGELPLFLQNGFGAYFFGLPTCVLGGIFFAAIFIASARFYIKTR
jgi:uncharacterized membrane protein